MVRCEKLEKISEGMEINNTKTTYILLGKFEIEEISYWLDFALHINTIYNDDESDMKLIQLQYSFVDENHSESLLSSGNKTWKSRDN